MQDRLAIHLRDHLNTLIDQYDVRLRTVPHYRNLTPALWLDLGQHILSLTAECIEANDDRLLIDYLHERAEQVAEHGMPPESFQRAVAIADEIVAPLTETIAEANFIAHLMSRAQITIWQVAAQKRREAEITLQDSAAYQQQLTRRLRTIIETTDELIKIPDLDTLYRRAVELAREKLGIERCGLFIVDSTQQYTLGTYGTDAEGNTTDERAVKIPIDAQDSITLSKDKLWIVSEAPRTYWKDGQQINAGVGWVVSTALRGTSGPIGIIYSDAFLSGAPLDQDLQDGFALYCSMLASLIERKRAEETSQESEKRLHTLIDSLPDQIFFKDTQGRVILNNVADARAMGVASPDEAVGKSVFDTYPPELARLYDADDRAVIESGQPFFNREEPSRDAMGQPTWTLTTKVPITDSQGKRVGLIGIAHDITQRRRLEQQIRDSLELRTSQVQVGTQVAQDIAAAPNLAELFQRVVTLVKERFDYYYAQIFRYEPSQDALVLIAGYGEAGQKLLIAGHRLVIGRGVVGTAAATAHSVLATDVTTNPDWRPNPNLPNTKGELAVPIKLRDEVLGILDVQSDRAGALTQEDQLLLENLCGQIAIAIESTRLLETLRRSEVELAQALQIAKLAHWEYDLEKQLYLFNDQFYAIFHTTAEQQGGYQLTSVQYAQRFVHPEDRSVVGAQIQKALQSTDPHYSRQIEHRILYADGGVGYVSANINIDLDEHGHIVRYYGANQDITASKLAEEAVRRSEAQLSEALHIAKLAHWEYDVAKDLFHFNDQFYAIFHTTAEREGGYQLSSAQYAQRFVYPDDLAVVGSEIEKALTSTDRHYSRQIDHRILYADGGVGYISVSINIDRDEQGQILRYYGANQDITASKLAEETVRRSEAELAEALQIAKLAHWEYDVAKDLFHFNDQFYAIFHTTAEREGGYQLSSAQYAQRFVYPDDLAVVGSEIEKALTSTDRHYSRQIDHRILYGDGGVGYISVSINIDRDEQGQILRYYGANQDITASKLAEETLRRSEAELAQALQIAKLAHWEYDVAKDLFHFNDQFYAIFHTTAEREGGYQLSSAQYAQRFVYPEDLAVVGTEIEKALTSTDRHYSRQIDHRILYADGGIGYISVSINIDRDEQGQILRYYGANQDITEQKRDEQQMQETLRELEHLYATVSREGWQTYRQSGRLPAGYRFDQTLIQPAEQVWTAEIEQAILQQALVTSQTADHAVAVAPIKVRGEVIGTLGVYDNPNQPLQPEQLALVESISEQVALALESARLFDQTRQALSETEQLYNINVQISKASTLEDLVHAAAAPSVAAGSSGAGIWLFDLNDLGQPTEMEYKAAWSRAGAPPLPIGTRLRIENFPSSRLWLNENGQSTFVSRMDSDERVDPAMRAMFQQANIAATGFMPLMISNRWIGLIIVSWQEPHDFTAGEQRMYQAIASQVVVAIENRRLFEQTQHDAERERIVNYIAGQIRNAQSVEQVLSIATQELRLATMASRSIAKIAPRSLDQTPNGNDHGSQPDR